MIWNFYTERKLPVATTLLFRRLQKCMKAKCARPLNAQEIKSAMHLYDYLIRELIESLVRLSFCHFILTFKIVVKFFSTDNFMIL